MRKQVYRLVLVQNFKMPSQTKNIVRSKYPDIKLPNVSLGEFIESKINQVIQDDPNRTFLVSKLIFASKLLIKLLDWHQNQWSHLVLGGKNKSSRIVLFFGAKWTTERRCFHSAWWQQHRSCPVYAGGDIFRCHSDARMSHFWALWELQTVDRQWCSCTGNLETQTIDIGTNGGWWRKMATSLQNQTFDHLRCWQWNRLSNCSTFKDCSENCDTHSTSRQGKRTDYYCAVLLSGEQIETLYADLHFRYYRNAQRGHPLSSNLHIGNYELSR